MKTVLGFVNLALLTLNLSTLGTVAYKSEFWKGEPQEVKSSTYETIQEALDLDAAQARQIENQREIFVSDWETIGAELQAARQRLLAAVRNEDTDASQIRRLVDDIAALQTRLERQAVSQLLQERDLLSSEQQERYFSYVENRLRQRWGQMRGRQGGGVGRDQGSVPNEPRGRGRGGKRKGGRKRQ
jgi:Spy/CpxP family protein refolding chaperone